MAALSRNLWAPIVKTKRGGEWIVWSCISGTRRQAKAEYIRGVEPAYVKGHLQRVRFGRVAVVEQPTE